MPSLKLQKRLAASELGCGKHRVWLDPNEGPEISLANSRMNIRRLIKNAVIVRKPIGVHSRARTRLYREAKAKGRHMGFGRRRGTRNARAPFKLIWIRRQRVLRRLLRKYRANKKIDRHVYHTFYMKCKGNQYKNKRVLIEAIHTAKNQQAKERAVKEQLEARKAKSQAAKDKKAAKLAKQSAEAEMRAEAQ
eukprot:GHVN01101691.1.p1 GENE.GHVN01101691.1~~GHVN01101691.1.p1  ORF type:complete len:192 (+),score=24.30 GHVN01101691.1:116-691(+)